MYLSAIETLVCRRETSFIESSSFGFSQIKVHGFQNTVLKVALQILGRKFYKNTNINHPYTPKAL